jgi:hypothetical protein
MPKKTKLGLDVRLKAEITVINELLKSIDTQTKLQNIASQFPEMLHMPIMRYPPFEDDSIEEYIPAGKDITKARIEQYAKVLHEFAEQRGLSCDWIVDRLHTAIRNIIFPRPRIGFGAVEIRRHIDDFKVNILITPETRREDIDRAVDKEWKRITENPKYRQRIKQPQDFDIKVRFLIKRLVFKRTLEGIANQANALAESAGRYSPESVEQDINKAARLLDIRLRKKRSRKIGKI